MTTARLISPPLLVEWREDGRRVLQRELVVDVGLPLEIRHRDFDGFDVSGRITTLVTVPRGFDHDGSSIPPWAGAIMGDEDGYEVAGVCHDYAYRVQLPRTEADRMWWIVARSSGPKGQVGPVRGFLGWAALRLFGWAAYRSRA